MTGKLYGGPWTMWIDAADDATRQWTGKFNPRPLQAGDFVSLYRRAFGLEN